MEPKKSFGSRFRPLQGVVKPFHDGLLLSLAILGAVWSLRGFKNRTAVTDLPMVPFHPVAIDFYRSKGIWSGKISAANAALK